MNTSTPKTPKTSKTLKRAAAIALSTLVIPVGVAVTGAAPASAGPDLCVSGPYGYAKACVEAPDWPGRWHGGGPHWKNRGHDYDD